MVGLCLAVEKIVTCTGKRRGDVVIVYIDEASNDRVKDGLHWV